MSSHGVCKMYNIGGDDTTSGDYRLFRSAVGSGYSHPCVAELANDCDRNTFYHSLYGERYAWWNVDLGSSVSIYIVRVHPYVRTPDVYNRFHDVEVSVGMVPAVGGDASAYTVLGLFIGPFTDDTCCSVDFSLGSPVSARYVHVRLTTANSILNDYLLLEEVEVLTQEF
ncbi:uncharacterized protein LOC134780893 [Penaeus indicus]|uniref:uncharacterized protein LOC134780893 n=1 Tax=Penaeus indicus TaxID=29960 RepID=UPI00300CDD8E